MIWLFEMHKSVKWYVEWVIVTWILFYLTLCLLVCLLREAYKILIAKELGRPSDEISSLLYQKGFVIENHYKWWILFIGLLCIPYKLFFSFQQKIVRANYPVGFYFQFIDIIIIFILYISYLFIIFIYYFSCLRTKLLFILLHCTRFSVWCFRFLGWLEGFFC